MLKFGKRFTLHVFFFLEMCRSGISNPRFPGSILSRHVLACADRGQNAAIALGITLRDKYADIAFLEDTVLLVVPLLVIGLKLPRTSLAAVLAELAAPPADLHERCGRC